MIRVSLGCMLRVSRFVVVVGMEDFYLHIHCLCL